MMTYDEEILKTCAPGEKRYWLTQNEHNWWCELLDKWYQTQVLCSTGKGLFEMLWDQKEIGFEGESMRYSRRAVYKQIRNIEEEVYVFDGLPETEASAMKQLKAYIATPENAATDFKSTGWRMHAPPKGE